MGIRMPWQQGQPKASEMLASIEREIASNAAVVSMTQSEGWRILKDEIATAIGQAQDSLNELSVNPRKNEADIQEIAALRLALIKVLFIASGASLTLMDRQRTKELLTKHPQSLGIGHLLSSGLPIPNGNGKR